MGKVKLTHGMKQLLSDDPCSPLMYAIEQVQDQAHHRRLGRVLRRLTRRKYELGWVHASEAGQPCARVVAAQLLGYKLPREKPDPKLSRIFENGTFMHLRYYNYFLSLSSPFEVKIAVVLRQWPLIGEADVIVYHPEMGNIVVELKSINTRNFKLLTEPQEGHAAQINTYQGLLQEASGGIVWYEDKNTQDMKAFSHKYNPELFNPMMERVEFIADSVIRGLLPDACGGCEYDEFVGNLKKVEERMAKLAEVRDNNA